MIARHLSALLITLLTVSTLYPVSAVARQPNVILILADDLGYQDLGCYGHPSIRTPVLDQLATDGIRLTDFHSGATVCTPSRMALLTGAYPTRLGWTRGVCGHLMGMHDGMSTNALTITEIFKSEGYTTAISGKWHIGDQLDTRPWHRGFDSSYFLTHSNNQTTKIWRDNKIVEDPFDNRKLTEKLTTEAIRFIREHRDKPFFLYLPYTAPHFPVQPHPEWKGRSKFNDYGDVVEELDSRIGDLLATLRELAIDKETIVIFTSDNGPNPKEASSPLPFRGEKWSALEGGTRVPCIIAWPGVIPAGQVNGNLISAMDLLPSLCHATGIDLRTKTQDKPKIDGVDVWNTLLGKADGHPRSELLYWHGTKPEPQAFRSGDSKLFFDRKDAFQGPGTERASTEQLSKIAPIRAELTPGVNPPILFNLRDDPGETTDQSGASPEKLKALQLRAEALIAELKADPILPLSTAGEKK